MLEVHNFIAGLSVWGEFILILWNFQDLSVQDLEIVIHRKIKE